MTTNTDALTALAAVLLGDSTPPQEPPTPSIEERTTAIRLRGCDHARYALDRWEAARAARLALEDAYAPDGDAA